MSQPPSQRIERTDALVIGGGPIGLLVAAQLIRFKCSAIVVERDDKPSMPIYGRATTLWCRTLELLDQLDLCEPLMEEGCFTKDGINFRDGKSAPGGLTFGQRMHKHGDTRFNMSLHLRQRLIERKFEQALEDAGSPSRHHIILESFTVDESASESKGNDDSYYPVTSILRDTHTDEVYTVKSKTIVGVDGGHSFVRKTAGIEFKGDRSANKWIRLDAIIETDMPSPRTLNSVQSDTHGLVLWCPIDSGRVRMGYVFNKSLQEKYGENGVTGEVAMEEAKKAVAPFKLEFKKLDWFTLYGIGQCMAETFQKGPVFLAGDACHTHSSGSAQGLNTGTFDAVNLAWKLALYLRGFATKELVESYSSEREVGVKQVIENDRIIATLISGQLPPKYEGRTEPPRVILDEWFNDARNVAFTLGLGVQYPADNIINVSRAGQALSTVGAGERGPETYVTRLGTNERVPLQRLMPNTGSFHVVLFAGIPRNTQPSLEKLRAFFDGDENGNWEKRYHRGVVKTLSLLAATGPSATDVLGGLQSFGRTFYDSALEAHCAYGVDPVRGAIIVFRPDGYIGTVAPLAEPELVSEYFARFLIPKSKKLPSASLTNGAAQQNGH